MRLATMLLLIFMVLGRTDFSPVSKLEPVAAPEPEPVAVVTQITGVVILKPASAHKGRQIDSTTLLYENDEVSIGKAGEALLLQVNAPAQRLIENDKRTIKPLSPPPPRGAFTRGQMSRYKQRYAGASNNIRRKPPRSKRKKKLLTVLTLRSGLLLNPKPLLAWTRVTGVHNYLVRLLDNDNNVIWSQTTKEPKTFDAPALAPGEYKWDVTMIRLSASFQFPTLYDSTAFTAVTGEQAEEIKRELQEAREVTGGFDGANLAYVAVCLEYKQYRTAEAELKKGLLRTPSDKVLWVLLAETYQAMERWDNREMAKKFFSNPKPTKKMLRFLSEGDSTNLVQ